MSHREPAMKEWQWDEILQHPQRPLTEGQWNLVNDLNLASLSRERLAALAARLRIEGTRMMMAKVYAPQASVSESP